MGDIKGFLKHGRELPNRRPVPVRLRDWKEVYDDFPADHLMVQASRCMDCGIPFCSNGCPLGNIIPDWNDLVYRDRWQEAIARLHATNNFPEFTGRLCPAPCESACVLGINNDPVTIKQVELTIIERAWDEGWVKPQPAAFRTGKTVAVIGSGPAGLACAQQLARAGHDVTVFERDDRIGGLLRYGIPDFKMEKRFLDRRLAQMEAEGVTFKPGVHMGVDMDVRELQTQFDALCLAGGAANPRNLPVEGRDLKGVHFAMEYLPQQNKRNAGDEIPEGEFISAKGKRVIILDDMIDTAGTMVQAAAALEAAGAVEVVACCTHAVLSGPAIDRIDGSNIKEVIVTNTIPLHERAQQCKKKITVLPVAGLLSEAVRRIYYNDSVSSLFI